VVEVVEVPVLQGKMVLMDQLAQKEMGVLELSILLQDFFIQAGAAAVAGMVVVVEQAAMVVVVTVQMHLVVAVLKMGQQTPEVVGAVLQV